MSQILYWFEAGVLLANSLLAVLVAYLVMLTLAALRARRVAQTASRPTTRFLVVAPAHNEEQLLPQLLASLAAQDYPRGLVGVHVVADNCTDQTAAVARAAGAHVHERTERGRAGKGPALQWLLQRLWRAHVAHDAVVFVDADTILSRNFLRAMAARLEGGAQVVQGFYTVRNLEQSAPASLRYMALAALHYLRPLGRRQLGMSAGLKGNGMALAAPLLRQRAWSNALTEDIEMHMGLLLAGQTVAFAPDAVALAEMPNTLAVTEAQLNRWEGGRLLMARRYVPQLLGAAWAQARSGQLRRSLVLLDAVMEHLIPPFSLVAAATVGLLAAAAGGWAAQALAGDLPAATGLARLNVGLGAAMLAGQALYVLVALWLVRAPVGVYVQLLGAPVYVAWKVRQYVRAWLGRGRTQWLRTRRNEAA